MPTQISKSANEISTTTLNSTGTLLDAPSFASISGTTLTLGTSLLAETGSFDVVHTFSQVGSTILGDGTNRWLGQAVASNSDGSIVAVGDRNDSSGRVRVYEYSSNSWSQLGSALTSDGMGNTSTLGNYVSLSSDGATLAFGGDSSCQVHTYSGGTWSQKGSTISGRTDSVSLNGDGTILVRGTTNRNSSRGGIRYYKWSGSSWGSHTDGVVADTIGDEFGHSVAMNNDGTRLIAGTDGANYIQIYDADSSGILSLSQTLSVSNNGGFGKSVSINYDGTVVAIGAMSDDDDGNTDIGSTVIYAYISGSWSKLGSTIVGESEFDNFGTSVSLNDDGDIIAIGAMNANVSGGIGGHVRIFKYSTPGQTGGSWSQIGTDIDGQSNSGGSGEDYSDRLGYSIALNSDGSRIIIGSIWDDSSSNNQAGSIKMYDLLTRFTYTNFSYTGNFYIDEVRIITDNGSRFSANNILHYASKREGNYSLDNIVTNTGLKWVVKVTNGSGSTFNPGEAGEAYGIALKLFFIKKEETSAYMVQMHYREDVSIGVNESIYFGWSGQGVTIVENTDPGSWTNYNILTGSPNNLTQEFYLPDQAISDDQEIATHFSLKVRGGSSYRTYDGAGPWLGFETRGGDENVPAIPFLIAGTSSTTGLSGTGSVSTGSYIRKNAENLTQVVPNNNDKVGDWNISSQATSTAAATAVTSNTTFTNSLTTDVGLTTEQIGNITSQLNVSTSNTNGLQYNGSINIPDKNLSEITESQQNNLKSAIKSSYATELGVSQDRIIVTLSSGSIIANVEVYGTSEEASSAPVYNNLYIDEVRIITDSGSRFSANNILNNISSGTLPTSTVINTGLKWVVQITNASNATIATANTIKLTIETITTNGDKYEQSFTHTLGSSIADNGSIYFGWSGQGATIVSSNIAYASTTNISDPTTQEIYLADQAVSGSQIVGTRFRLFYNGTEVDRVGSDYVSSTWRTNENQTNIPSIPFLIQGASTATGLSGTGAVSTGSYTRKIQTSITQDIPTLNDNTGDWNVQEDDRFSASASGDPHITTLEGGSYRFKHTGPFRYFEDVVEDTPLIINGFSHDGKHADGSLVDWMYSDICGTEEHPEYIKKICIQYGEKMILIDTGFRGINATVLECSGIEFQERELTFHKRAKRMYRNRETNKIYFAQHNNEPVSRELPALTRNQIIVPIYSKKQELLMSIIIQNVNMYNYQPSRTCVLLEDRYKISNEAKGCIVHEKYANYCMVDDMKSSELLKDPDGETMPEMEVAVKIRSRLYN